MTPLNATLPDTALSSAERRTDVAAPIIDLLADRWSPRSFESTAVISEEDVAALLEAARWAPSAANFQPRRFVVARRGTATFDAITAALSPGNQPWAPRGSLYIVAYAVSESPDGRAMRWADYDAGQAIAHLTVQAQALGLAVHQMGGFDPEALRTAFDLPKTMTAVSVSIVGVPAAADALDERFQSRETAARDRLPIDELVLLND